MKWWRSGLMDTFGIQSLGGKMKLIKSERFINLLGYDHNVAFLDERKLFKLGLITNEEVNTILAAKTPPVHELLSAMVPTTDEFECAICLERSVEGLVWHPKKCHIFHSVCLNLALKRKTNCPI